MGINTKIKFKTSKELTKQEIKELQYHLMHRVEKSFFWIDENEKFFITPTDIPNIYEIKTLCRYYGIGYERGSALQIITVLLYLESKEYSVFYGGDSFPGLPSLNKEKILELLDYYIEEGNFPYLTCFTSQNDIKEENIPFCSFCNVKMNRYGFGIKYAVFNCLGCRETQVYKDIKFDKKFGEL